MECAESLINIKSSDTENYKCPDCPGTSSHVLIDFGCFICASCSKIHLRLGNKCKIQSDYFSDLEIKQISSGGNKAIQEFFKYYNLSTRSIQEKYQTRAALFYKEMIKNLAKDIQLEEDFPELHEGASLVPSSPVQEISYQPRESFDTSQNSQIFKVEHHGHSTFLRFINRICRCFIVNSKKVALKVGWQVKDSKENIRSSKSFSGEIVGTQLGIDKKHRITSTSSLDKIEN